jgi:hypothetical protein
LSVLLGAEHACIPSHAHASIPALNQGVALSGAHAYAYKNASRADAIRAGLELSSAMLSLCITLLFLSKPVRESLQ